MTRSCNSPNKSDNPGLVVLALSVFETEMRDLDAGDELHLLGGAHHVQLGQDLARVRGEGDQHRQVGQRHQGHVVLGVGASLRVGDQIHSILRMGQYYS